MSSEPLMNLQRIGLLDVVPASPQLRARMLQAAHPRLADALRSDATRAPTTSNPSAKHC
jgi:hypothetical protein